ncbi:hypothetical protein ACOI1H_07305 [Loktanella sp. DJP18]|uniref:hypothetical protein n=1 Tax=Loktanella sp. DJP18 TaxID=3409788 RepID=UPI003BB54BDC
MTSRWDAVAAIKQFSTEWARRHRSLADGRTDVTEIVNCAGAYLRQQLPIAMKAVH